MLMTILIIVLILALIGVACRPGATAATGVMAPAAVSA